MNKEEIEQIIKEKGMDWLVAAMVDGSIGYHSPKGAKQLINMALAGGTRDACERCLACFGGDLLEMIEFDVRGFSHVSEARADRLVKFVQAAGNLTPIQEMGLSAMYPTMGV